MSVVRLQSDNNYIGPGGVVRATLEWGLHKIQKLTLQNLYDDYIKCDHLKKLKMITSEFS